jgi:hypothetical protein
VARGCVAVLVAALMIGGQPAGSATTSESATPQQWAALPDAPPGTLASVSCPTASRCFAVGRDNDGNPIASILIGHRWWPTRVGPRPTAASRSYSLVDVSCVSASACVAVGRYYDGRWRPLVNTWAGAGWSFYRGPARVTDFSGVSCMSTEICFAIGSSSGSARVEIHAGVGWHASPLPRLPLGAIRVLRGIDCVSATFCVAVGSATPSGRSPQTLAMMWNGTAWSSAPRPLLPSSSRGRLNAVSCVSAVSCFAVGVQDNDRTLIERWDGARWSVVPSVDESVKYFSNTLTGVSCVTAVSCVAVGSARTDGILLPGQHLKAVIETWNGTAWSLTNPTRKGDTDTNSLTDVSCTSGHCAAVGSYESSRAPTHSLGFSGDVAPRTVRVFWSAADNARLLQVAAYLHQSPAATQQTAVSALAYVLGFGSHRVTPVTLPPARTEAGYTTVWQPSELGAIDTVRAQYTLDSGGATRVAVAFLSYVLALGGH